MTHPTTAANDAQGKKLRILEVLEPSGGGSGRHFLDLSRELSKRGHHVEAIYSPLRAEPRFVDELLGLDLARVHRISMTRAPGPADLAAHRAIHRIVAQNGPFDIVHGHSSKAGALTRMRFSGRTRPKVVYTPHAFRTLDPTLGRGGRMIYGMIESLFGRMLTDHLICVSDDEYTHARALGIPKDRMSVIVNGIVLPPVHTAGPVRARFAIPEHAFVFGFIGRLSHQKAPERLVEAFNRIAATLPAAHLVMIGAGEGDTALRHQIAESGLSSRIHLTTAFTGMEAVSAFDALVMPSRYEAMSYVMLEAAAAGKPVIATDIGGASTVIAPGVNGLIVANSDDVSALSAAMVTVAQEPTRSQMATAASDRRHAWSLDAMVDKTEALYRKLITTESRDA